MNRNTAVAHVLLTLVFSAWAVEAGTSWFWTGLLWLALMGLAFGLVFPSLKKDETEADAWRGAWMRVACDPLLHAGLAATLFFIVQAVNGGRELVYDPVAERWFFSPPPWRWGPSSVVMADAWRTATLAFVFTCLCVTLRQAVNKGGRILLLRGMSVNAAALAFWEIARLVLRNAAGLYSLPAFLFPASSEAVGAFYVLMMAVSGGLLLDDGLNGRWAPWTPAPLALHFAGACLSGDPPAILTAWLLAGVGGFYALRYAWPFLWGGQRMKNLIFGIAPVLIAGVAYFRYYPGNPLLLAVRAAGSWGGWFAEWARGLAGATGAAFRMMGDHRWFGVGAGGFKAFAPFYGLDAYVRDDGRAGVDLAEYLCEHGLAGCALVALALGVLLIGHIRRLALLPHVTSGISTIPDRCWLFRMTPLAVMLSFGAILIVLLSAAGSVFHSPFVSLSWCATVTCLGSFLPMRKAM